MREDPADPPPIPKDPGDAYLIALAAGSEAVLVTGDRDLFTLASELPILSARRFLKWLEGLDGR